MNPASPPKSPIMADRISDLPDAILCRILSILPTKHAVATSVLSKRWKPLWRFVPTLDFDYDNYTECRETYSRFVQSVSAVLLLRDLNQPIKKFRLRCSSSEFCDPNDVRIWIHAAVQRRVQHLDLSLPLQWFWDLYPRTSIISSSTLVVLKLEDMVLQPPSSVHFPSLKILHMENVCIVDLLYLSNFLSGCPIVEDLKASRLYFHNGSAKEEFEILPKLIRALIYKHDIFLLKAASNAKFLHITEMDDPLSDEDEMDTDEDINDDEHTKQSYKDFVPVFHNLTHIELNYRTHYTDWIEVVEILHRCPQLQILLIDKGTPRVYPEQGRQWSKPQSVPKCISLHLITCCLNNYKGLEGEFQFASYIMQNARHLRTLTISCSSLVNQREKLKMLQRLSMCTRCSTACKLSFK